jgi:hypothetical protein
LPPVFTDTLLLDHPLSSSLWRARRTQGFLKHDSVTCLSIGLLALIIRLALLPWLPIPEPVVHDEFSYLLGAETFASGRLTNPAHPLWIHFETFHVNQQPTYATKYPPAQSLVLAMGQRLFGNYWFGVWLSVGFMCACLTWMVQGWAARRYALMAGLIAIAQWGVTGYWINSYWGGALGAAGGALVLGAVPRLVRRVTASSMALGTLGVLLLANTRPYEGALTVMGALMALVLWRRRAGYRLSQLFLARAALPATMLLVAGVAGMAYYNYRVTGDPLVLPYVVNQKQYSSSPHLWILPAGHSVSYRHDIMRRFWIDWDMPLYFAARANPGIVLTRFARFILPFFISPLTGLLIAIAVVLRRGWKVHLALALAAVPAVGILMEKSSWMHYFSPATGLVLFLAMCGLQFLRTARIRGVRLGTYALVVFAGVFLMYASLGIASEIMSTATNSFANNRRSVIHTLEAAGGRHLVIVRYSPEHAIHEEWIYNHADIDGSSIVWAHDMGAQQNRELCGYYRGRNIWLLDPDAGPSLLPYRANP